MTAHFINALTSDVDCVDVDVTRIDRRSTVTLTATGENGSLHLEIAREKGMRDPTYKIGKPFEVTLCPAGRERTRFKLDTFSQARELWSAFAFMISRWEAAG